MKNALSTGKQNLNKRDYVNYSVELTIVEVVRMDNIPRREWQKTNILRSAYIVWEGRKMSQGRSGVTEAKGGDIKEVEAWQGPGNAYLT